MTLTLHLLLLPPCPSGDLPRGAVFRLQVLWKVKEQNLDGQGKVYRGLPLSLTLKGQGDWEWETFQAGQFAKVNSEMKQVGAGRRGPEPRAHAGKKELVGH